MIACLMGSLLSRFKCTRAQDSPKQDLPAHGQTQGHDLEETERPILSMEDRNIVGESWAVFHAQLDGGGAEMFINKIIETEEFEDMAKSVSPIVVDRKRSTKLKPPFSFHVHFFSVLEVVGSCASRINDVWYLERLLHEVGVGHALNGTNPAAMQLMVPPFLAGMRTSMGEEQWTLEVDAAWEHFFAFIVHIIKEPMGEIMRRNRRTLSLTCHR